MNPKRIQSFIQDVPLKSLQQLCHIQNDLLSLLNHISLYFKENVTLKNYHLLLPVCSQHPAKCFVFK